MSPKVAKACVIDGTGTAFFTTHQISQEYLAGSNNSLKDSVVKLNVPYISQNDVKSCATTSIAMIISYYENLNIPLDKETVWKISGLNENMIRNYGNDMEGLKRIADHYGFKSKYIKHMEIADIESFLFKGIPVMLNVGKGRHNHALLIVGYDKNKETFYINDPSNSQNKTLEYSYLTTHWYARLSSPKGLSHQSGFIIYPKNY